MKTPWFVITSLAIAQAVLLVLSYVWFHALQFNNGVITACVNCVGEGLIELGLFVLASALTILSLTWVAWPRGDN